MPTPSTMQAVALQPGRSVKVEERLAPLCGPNRLLIRNTAFGQNPSDWKHAAFLSEDPEPGNGVIMGCDSVGVVDQIGSDVPAGFTSKGERRGIFMHGATSTTNGAFAEYTVIDHDLTFRVPSNLSDLEAATVPACFFTACQFLFQYMGLPEPESPPRELGPTLLVWSGASSVGQFIIQLAKLSGCRVVTTASPANWDYLKSLGAHACFDYRDQSISQRLRDATDDSISYAVDCFGEQSSVELVYNAMSTTLPSVIYSVLPIVSPLTHKPNVKLSSAILYTALGKDIQLGRFFYPMDPQDRPHHVEWLKKGPSLFEEGKIRPLRYRLAGTLHDIGKGFEEMQAGKVAAEKLVYARLDSPRQVGLLGVTAILFKLAGWVQMEKPPVPVA